MKITYTEIIEDGNYSNGVFIESSRVSLDAVIKEMETNRKGQKDNDTCRRAAGYFGLPFWCIASMHLE